MKVEGKRLYTGSWDRSVKVKASSHWRAPGHKAVNNCMYVCVCGGIAQVWELNGRQVSKCLQTLRHDGKVNCIQASRSMLISGCSDKLIRIWDPQRGEVQASLKGKDLSLAAQRACVCVCLVFGCVNLVYV